MKFISTFLLFLVFSNTYSQKLDTIYISQDSKKISKSEFYALDDSKIRVVINNVVAPPLKTAYSPRNVGMLDSIQASQIGIYLQKIIGSDYNKTKTTLIHLYQKNDEQIKDASESKEYWSHYKNKKDKYQAFLLGGKNSGVVKNQKKHIHVDEHNLIGNLFFKTSNYNINHLIIKPSGEIYTFYGTSDLLYILDYSTD